MRGIITHDQAECLNWIKNFIRKHGHSPSYREIALGIGVASTSTVSHHVNKLVERGWLTFKCGAGTRNLKLRQGDDGRCPLCGAAVVRFPTNGDAA